MKKPDRERNRRQKQKRHREGESQTVVRARHLSLRARHAPALGASTLFSPRHGAHRPKAIGASHSPGHSDWSRGEHVTKVGPLMLHDFTLPHPRRREHPLLQYLLSLTNRSYDF